jgi:hypothetical protein
MPAAKSVGQYIPDDFDHEIATSYMVKGKGLVVLTSCSHRGVINAVQQAQKVSGIDKVHAVIGGFHIVPPLGDDYIRQTIAAFQEIDPDPDPGALHRGQVLRSRARCDGRQGHPLGGGDAVHFRRVTPQRTRRPAPRRAVR